MIEGLPFYVLRKKAARPNIFFKKHRHGSLILVAAVVCCSAGIGRASAQPPQRADVPQNGAAVKKLAPPMYPALAHQARIQGDVEVRVDVRQDGSVGSADVISGHPMLAPAALASARESQFECRGCSDPVTSYAMVYTFQLAPTQTTDVSNNDAQLQPIHVTQSQNHVTVSAEPMPITCALTARLAVRSAKCLYLWRCGSR
jgi:TonB family protein